MEETAITLLALAYFALFALPYWALGQDYM
jgi:hypothetical protein